MKQGPVIRETVLQEFMKTHYLGYKAINDVRSFRYIYINHDEFNDRNVHVPKIQFVEQKKINDSPKVYELRVHRTSLGNISKGTSYVSLLKLYVLEIKTLLKPNTTDQQFTSIVRDILAARFIYNTDERFDVRELEYLPCLEIRNIQAFSSERDVIGQVAAIVMYDSRGHTKTRMKTNSVFVKSKRGFNPGMIFHIEPPNMYIFPTSREEKITKTYQLVQWVDPNRYLLNNAGSRTECMYFKIDKQYIKSMYVSSNLLPFLTGIGYGVASEVYSDDDGDYSEYTEKINVYGCNLVNIKYGNKLSELIEYTDVNIKDKSKLIYLIAGILYAKTRFNEDNRMDGYTIYGELEWFISRDDIYDTLVLWTKYITAQYTISDIEDELLDIEEIPEIISDDNDLIHSDGSNAGDEVDIPTLIDTSGGGSTKVQFNADQEHDSTEYTATRFIVKINKVVHKQIKGTVTYDRNIIWSFEEGGKIMIIENNEDWMYDSDFEIEKDLLPGNRQDIESQFTMNEQLNAILVSLAKIF